MSQAICNACTRRDLVVYRSLSGLVCGNDTERGHERCTISSEVSGQVGALRRVLNPSDATGKKQAPFMYSKNEVGQLSFNFVPGSLVVPRRFGILVGMSPESGPRNSKLGCGSLRSSRK